MAREPWSGQSYYTSYTLYSVIGIRVPCMGTSAWNLRVNVHTDTHLPCTVLTQCIRLSIRLHSVKLVFPSYCRILRHIHISYILTRITLVFDLWENHNNPLPGLTSSYSFKCNSLIKMQLSITAIISNYG